MLLAFTYDGVISLTGSYLNILEILLLSSQTFLSFPSIPPVGLMYTSPLAASSSLNTAGLQDHIPRMS